MPSDDPLLLDINSLLAGEWPQCLQLLQHSYPSNHAQGARNLSADQLKEILSHDHFHCQHKLLPAIAQRCDKLENLSPEHFAMVRFCDQLFDNYFHNCRLDSELHALLNTLRPLALLSLLDQTLPWKPSQALPGLLNCLHQQAIGWQSQAGRAAQRFYQQLETLFQKAPTTDDLLNNLNAFFNTEQQRISKLEQRLYDAEIGALHAKHAQQLSAKTLNQQMAGKQLPVTISRFLLGPWRESMRLMIIGEGKSSDSWRRMLRLTETLIWSFQPFDKSDLAYQQQVYHSISDIAEQLREVTVGLHHSSKLDEELALIEEEHLKILKGETLDYAPFDLIDNTDPLLSSQVSVSQHLIKQASGYDQGQWFIDQSGDQEKRIKLSLKISQAQQLLFTNFLGIKTVQYSFEEFAYLLSSKIIQPVDPRDPFTATGEKIFNTLLQRYQEQQQQAASEAAIEQEILRQQELSRQAAREKALQEAKAHTAVQRAALTEARKQQELKQAREATEQHEKLVHQQLAKLAVGAIIRFNLPNQPESEQNSELCKLAAIIQSTGQHVFVNRQGIKRYSLSREQLAEQLLHHTASVMDVGSNFDNTLETVVNGLRARKTP